MYWSTEFEIARSGSALPSDVSERDEKMKPGLESGAYIYHVHSDPSSEGTEGLEIVSTTFTVSSLPEG